MPKLTFYWYGWRDMSWGWWFSVRWLNLGPLTIKIERRRNDEQRL